MIKLEINDFVQEIYEELVCYEEVGEEKALKWKEKITAFLENANSKDIKKTKDKTYYQIEDESEIFDLADKYLEALQNGKEEEYWKKPL
ncbi:MAG: hypothetical protein IJS61_00380 [Firmicutes bacterium]|nr:hypothetical protein [Bacillota bacterium]